MDIKNKRACITGASSGIGLACAVAFARAGVHVCLVARRRARLDELASDISKKYGVESLPVELDVRDREGVGEFADRLPAVWRRFDIVVNNAGLSRGLDPIHRASLSDWDEMIDTNVKGLLYVTRVLVSRMVEFGGGHVINIGSVAGHEVYGGGSVYCATKHAENAISRAMMIDLLGTGVRVSSVDPGMVETEFSFVRFHGDVERASAVYKGIQPLTADDVADAVLYCATRPAHANVREMVLMPTAQASVTHTYRTT